MSSIVSFAQVAGAFGLVELPAGFAMLDLAEQEPIARRLAAEVQRKADAGDPLAKELVTTRRIQLADNVRQDDPPRPGWYRRPDQAIGVGSHRSGWRVCLAALHKADPAPPILFDDFVDQTFCYQKTPPSHLQPWAGIFHHPPNMPALSPPLQRPQVFMAADPFRRSEPQLRGAIALSAYLGRWLSSRLRVPVFVVKHPTIVPALRWSIERFEANPDPLLLQVGYYLRNTRAIQQVPTLRGFRKARIMPRDQSLDHPWCVGVDRYWRESKLRPDFDAPEILPTATPAEYDALLSRNVVLTELFDASANNVVIECIARGTPLVVNRHPAALEYLGVDYPLAFHSIRDVPAMLADRSRIIAAHRQMVDMDRSWLDPAAFAAGVVRFVREIAK